MPTIFILADTKCCVRVFTDPAEIPKVMKDFDRPPWYRWEDISNLNKPGGCIKQHGTNDDYQQGPVALSITRYDI